MKKNIIVVPDKEIELEHGDSVKIYVKKKEVDFTFCCDGTGNVFSLTKEELKEMIK